MDLAAVPCRVRNNTACRSLTIGGKRKKSAPPGQVGDSLMQFSVARPDVVRAINQRWLLKFWKRHQGPHRVPRWQAVECRGPVARRRQSELSGGERRRRHGAFPSHCFTARPSAKSTARPTATENISTRSFRRRATPRAWRPIIGRWRPAVRSTPSTTSPTATAGWSITSGCCCPTRATEHTIGPHSGRPFEFVCPDGAFDGNALHEIAGRAADASHVGNHRGGGADLVFLFAHDLFPKTGSHAG